MVFRDDPYKAKPFFRVNCDIVVKVVENCVGKVMAGLKFTTCFHSLNAQSAQKKKIDISHIECKFLSAESYKTPRDISDQNELLC